ncbi:MAG: thioredoxin domain-containing protein [Nitrospirae bacterium]|nr:thioredoxin domain-containing protein [Nitrospirota bacterium]
MTAVEESVHIRCKSCGALNRVPAQRLAERPLCGKCKRFLEFPRSPVEAAAESFGREVFEWPGVVIVEFRSARCGACALIEPLLKRLAYQRAGLLKVVTVDIERELSLANRFQIRSTPTLLVYRNGRLLDELYGALPEDQMQAWIEAAINK